MKKFLTRLRLALQNRPYLQDRMDQDVPRTWCLRDHILDVVRVNVPRYDMGHPGGKTEEEWNEVLKRLVTLATEIQAYEECRGWTYMGNKLVSKTGFSPEEVEAKRQEFTDLLADNFRDLRD